VTSPRPTTAEHRKAHRAAVAILDAEFNRARIDLEDCWDASDLDALEQQLGQLLRATIAHSKGLCA
jgi:hypothetical protein